MDVTQDEILLSWLNHGDELKQQWAMWYMHNPEEWIEYKASHQRQSGATAGNTGAASSSIANADSTAAASTAPVTAAAGAAAQGEKGRNTGAAPAAAAGTGTQQYNYSQGYTQVCLQLCNIRIASLP
jgi:hypothetical protein